MLGNDGRMGRHHGMHPMSSGQPQHPVLPTYKWMQVKRNIPKPNGKCKKMFVSNSTYRS